MKKILACCCLLGGLAAASLLESPATAQGKKSAAGSIIVRQNKAGKYIFQVKNSEDKYVCGSLPAGYATEKEALDALDDLKKIVAEVKPTIEKGTSKDENKPKKKAG